MHFVLFACYIYTVLIQYVCIAARKDHKDTLFAACFNRVDMPSPHRHEGETPFKSRKVVAVATLIWLIVLKGTFDERNVRC